MDTPAPKTSLSQIGRLWVDSGGGRVPVSGRSMRPTFEDASRVWMVPASDIRFGDIVVQVNEDEDMLVVHRVVGTRGGSLFRTKGDGLPHLDPGLVPSSRVLGRVIGVERRGRRYSTQGRAGRCYGRVVGAGSAIEGFLYRFAYRLDGMIGAVLGRGVRGGGGGGPVLLRGVLRAGGRAFFATMDGALFRRLNPEEPQEPVSSPGNPKGMV